MAISQSSFSCGKAPLFPFRGKTFSKRAKVRAVSFGGSLLLCALLFWLNGKGALPIEPNVSASGLVSPEPPAYLLSSYEGKLAVYRSQETDPFMVFQVYLHNLPEQDQKALKEGLEVEDYRELDRLIEDYTS